MHRGGDDPAQAQGHGYGRKSAIPSSWAAFPRGWSLVARGEAQAFGKLQIRSIVRAALVKPCLVENGAEHPINPLKVYADGELLQVAKEYRALLRRNFLPAFRHHESIHDFEFPDSRHDYCRAANDGLKHGVRVGGTLVLKTPCNCYGVVEDEGVRIGALLQPGREWLSRGREHYLCGDRGCSGRLPRAPGVWRFHRKPRLRLETFGEGRFATGRRPGKALYNGPLR